MSFNPADYASVQERLPLFWAECPRGRIVTEIIVDDGFSNRDESIFVCRHWRPSPDHDRVCRGDSRVVNG